MYVLPDEYLSGPLPDLFEVGGEQRSRSLSERQLVEGLVHALGVRVSPGIGEVAFTISYSPFLRKVIDYGIRFFITATGSPRVVGWLKRLWFNSSSFRGCG